MAGGRAGRDRCRRDRAYAATRLPATYAAVAVALTELHRIAFAPVSQLDLGTGLGSAAWAAAAAFPSLRRVTAVDAVDGMLATAAAAAAAVARPPAVRERAVRGGARRSAYDAGGTVDLVTAAVRAERAADGRGARAARRASGRRRPARWCWSSPARPRTRTARDGAPRARLIALGATILAPLSARRPLPAAGDWCHFAVRLPRSSAHRAAKGARRGFEDEKFCYVVAIREADRDRARPRILRHPLVRPGHVRFRLCTAAGIEEATVARSDPGYREARKLSWGDRLEP